MRSGVDTDFLVAVEVEEHAHHKSAYDLFHQLLHAGGSFVLAPQVLAEFVHIATDQRRFPVPLSMKRALQRAQWWWTAAEVEHVFPSAGSVTLAFAWMDAHSHGRKRILDTQLVATLHMNEVTTLITNNHRDFRVFGCCDLVGYGERTI